MNQRVSLIALLAFALTSAARADKNETKDDNAPNPDRSRPVVEECLTVIQHEFGRAAITNYVCKDFTFSLDGNKLSVLKKGYAAMAAESLSGKITPAKPVSTIELPAEQKVLFEKDPRTFVKMADIDYTNPPDPGLDHEFIINARGMDRQLKPAQPKK